MDLKLLFTLLTEFIGKEAFESDFYKDALEPKLCQKQLQNIVNDPWLLMDFVESGIRLPRSILSGNLLDLGNYERCLAISAEKENMNIQGKYCSINLPLKQSLNVKETARSKHTAKWMITDEMLEELKQLKVMLLGLNIVGINENQESADLMLTVAVCVPKVCTTEQALNDLYNFTNLGLYHTDNYCRFENDKPWVLIDYVAIVIFSIIGLITLASTSYDLWHELKLNSDFKSISPVYQSFSLYSNTRRLLTFGSSPDALECVDGIRAFTMAWVILGHSFIKQPPFINNYESLQWSSSLMSIFITGAPIAVDTFFMLSGMLLVYMAAKKISGLKLLQNLHLFYIHRLLRMWPLLATAVLIKASLVHHIEDGPLWNVVAQQVNNCRHYWWSTLLCVQNLLNLKQEKWCLSQTWYLNIDMQLHILSPLMLFWILNGSRRVAWTTIFIGVSVILSGATIYNFLNKFPGAIIRSTRIDETDYYRHGYYVNTLARAPPFVIGMVFGYLLHLYRGKSVQWPKVTVTLIWLSVILLLAIALFSSYPMKDVNWDNQTVDSLVNSFSRAIWALGLGCMIFACIKGYGGPINWLLSLKMWKIPSRISYGMYLFHQESMLISTGSATSPVFFNLTSTAYKFISELVIAFVVAFIMTVIIDLPFSVLVNRALDPECKWRDAPTSPREESPSPTRRRANMHGVRLRKHLLRSKLS